MSKHAFRVSILVVALIVAAGGSLAGTDLNEVGALLVYPHVDGTDGQETYITITNVGASSITAHVAYINGDATSGQYCYECDFDIPLSGNDTELLVVTRDAAGGIVIQSEPDGTGGANAISHSCPHPFGFITVAASDETGASMTDNVLLGEQVVVDYIAGHAWSVSAIPFQGRNGGNGDRTFDFDDVEYGKLPRVIAADFIAPDIAGGKIDATITLFTPGFDRQFPPSVDCSVIGYDADENAFSRSLQFGCWTSLDLCEISPEFCYPNLGHFLNQTDTHGWLQLNCRVDQDGDGVYEADGGVHGLIRQTAASGAKFRRNDPAAPGIEGNAAWGRALYQSVTTGDPVSLRLSEPFGGGFQ